MFIPNEFSDFEKIVRSIFSPINISKNGLRIQPNAFWTPAEIDEVSVNRLSYTTINFCKDHSKKIQNPIFKRNYFGFALLYPNQIYGCNAKIVYTPGKNNKFHSDIKIGYIPQKGQALPSEFQKKIKDLAKRAKLFKDPNPDSKHWEGKTVE